MNQKNKTVHYFLLSNGLKTGLFVWDQANAILELGFEDFYLGGELYEKLRNIICVDTFKKGLGAPDPGRNILLRKIHKEEAQKVFINCHKYIWNTEKRGPLSAFTEFVKLIFLKLWNDRILHENFRPDYSGKLLVPQSANTFSILWIESREKDHGSPVNDISFKNLITHIEDDIDKRNKKRIFDQNEQIELKPTTIKGIVKKLEKIDLYGIDEDLNGRLFETFLNATMRGQALGQYFTPRSIVLLATELAELRTDSNYIEKVLDGSCGTGGFLIEAMSIMRNNIRENDSYSIQEKKKLIEVICNEKIFGIDAASEPNLAKISRINMYLHGDGGSHIYFADGLIKNIQVDKTDPRELQREIEEMKHEFGPSSFDVVLTNPPFSMWYEEKNESQKHILEQYNLTQYKTKPPRTRLRGSALFIERYCDLLRPGGKLITVLDETVLSSGQYSYLRDFIREKFIIRAVISLHGDAFQMAKARVKTALVYLQKKKYPDDDQPAAFMYSSIRLGVDDMPITTNPEKVKSARELAREEIKTILELYKRYRKGEKGEWFVQTANLNDRLDVKSCVDMRGRMIERWEKGSYEVSSLGELLTPQNDTVMPKDNPNKEFRILEITYSGRCYIKEKRAGRNINYKKMTVVHTGDLIFSSYNTFQGAMGYATEEIDGAVASNSYIVTRANNIEDSLYLWSILRTTEIRAEFLTSAIGMGRQTVKWDKICTVQVPLLHPSQREAIGQRVMEHWEAEKRAKDGISAISRELHNKFDVESLSSQKRFLGAKPPK